MGPFHRVSGRQYCIDKVHFFNFQPYFFGSLIISFVMFVIIDCLYSRCHREPEQHHNNNLLQNNLEKNGEGSEVGRQRPLAAINSVHNTPLNQRGKTMAPREKTKHVSFDCLTYVDIYGIQI